jgi:hypothetical protein
MLSRAQSAPLVRGISVGTGELGEDLADHVDIDGEDGLTASLQD